MASSLWGSTNREATSSLSPHPRFPWPPSPIPPPTPLLPPTLSPPTPVCACPRSLTPPISASLPPS
eukprot:3935059-Rhodomonas_salina.1